MIETLPLEKARSAADWQPHPMFGPMTAKEWASVQDEQDTVEFSLLESVEPMIEVMPLPKTRKAHDRMMAAKARFRVVLSMNGASTSN